PFCVDRKSAAVASVLIKPLADTLKNQKIKTVIVTGRSCADMNALWGFDERVQIWGSHGRERLFEDGKHEAALLNDTEANVLNTLTRELLTLTDKNNIEAKPFSVAFHTRALSENDKDTITVAKNLMRRYSDKYGFELHSFNGGFELKVSGYTKADAVKTLIDEHPDYPLAYFGDDLTDEDAFGVAAQKGLAVLVEQKREGTKSNFFMSSKDELSSFLQELNKVLS
ncbi:MAG: trehalose-phosphatase, partial [Campylobacterales bacterium]|nr:trehalose-phosphatase [Campylobacterales bacterium]